MWWRNETFELGIEEPFKDKVIQMFAFTISLWEVRETSSSISDLVWAQVWYRALEQKLITFGSRCFESVLTIRVIEPSNAKTFKVIAWYALFNLELESMDVPRLGRYSAPMAYSAKLGYPHGVQQVDWRKREGRRGGTGRRGRASRKLSGMKNFSLV